MAEITPVLQSFNGDFVEKMTVESVEDFNYVRNCWSESMRLQPPLPGSTPNSFCRDTVVKGIDFLTTDKYTINFEAIHKNPLEWQRPDDFIPERFDSKDPLFKRPDGKNRHPFSFCPFFGGKRICLGKTLAEYMTVFTLPLVLFHFEFQFVNQAYMVKKPNMQLFSMTTPEIPMRVKVTRKIKPQKK